jgi:hypothetical protein
MKIMMMMMMMITDRKLNTSNKNCMCPNFGTGL